MPIVWVMPTGEVQVTRIAEEILNRERRPNETTAEAVGRLASVIQAKTPWLASGVPTLVTEVNMPPTRIQRDKWRLQGNQVRVDPTVPDRPHPRQALLDEIEAATTVAALKVAVKKLATA